MNIAKQSTIDALRMVDKISQRTKELKLFPLLGAEVPEYGKEEIRELLAVPYRIIYRVRSDRIDVIAVIHSARQLPEDIETAE